MAFLCHKSAIVFILLYFIVHRKIDGKNLLVLLIASFIVLYSYDKLKNGDRKHVVRTDLYKRYGPMPEFPDERDFNPQWLHLNISKDYEYLVLNENLCYVDYQNDGMTTTVFKQYLRSPKSFRTMRLLDLSLDAPFRYLAKKTIHYVSSCILSKQPCISASPRKLMTLLLYPFGVVLTVYLKYTNREHI